MQIDYTIGDDIVCIKTHSQGVVKEGDVFKCKSLKEKFCKCKSPIVDIGIKINYGFNNCATCKIMTECIDGVHWIAADMFRKLDTLVNIDEIHELLNETIEY